MAFGSEASSAPREVENEHDQGDHEQEVNETTGDVESKSTAPEEQKKNGDNEEHETESHLAPGLAVFHPPRAGNRTA